jgi:hypothetical protein
MSALYLCGKMTGLPQFGYPIFHEAAEKLRSWGHDIISPAEIDDPVTQAEAMASPDGISTNGLVGGHTWGEILSRDVKIVADQVKGIVFLPGWETSRGAKLEAVVGLLCKHDFYTYEPGRLKNVGPDYVRRVLENYL